MFLEEFNNTSSPFWTLSDDLAFFKFLSLKKVHYWVEVLKKKTWNNVCVVKLIASLTKISSCFLLSESLIS